MLPDKCQKAAGHRLAGGTVGSGHDEPIADDTPAAENGQVGGQVAEAHHRGKLVLSRLHSVGNAGRKGPAAVAGRRTGHRLAVKSGTLLGLRTARIVGKGHGLEVGYPVDLTHSAVAFAVPKLEITIPGDEQELRATGVGELTRKRFSKTFGISYTDTKIDMF